MLRLWAPRASRVEVELAPVDGPARRLALDAVGGGWFAVDPGPLAAGDRYAFRLDGGPPRPDPRSQHQPDGVHAASAVVDHSTFAWTDAGWRAGPLASAVLYELHVGTFSAEGTFRGAVEHLDHLVDLGVTHVELLPVAAFDGVHGWGYDGVALSAPHPAYGEPDDLRALVDACHARGLAVLLDVVHNHLGPSGNYLHELGPYFTDRYHTPWGDAVNVDGPGSDEVRRFLCDCALGWLEHYHLDGLRLDAVHAIVDTSAYPYLEQLADEVDRLAVRLDRPLVLVAESDRNDPRLVQPPAVGGLGLDAHWCDELHHALHVVLTGETDGYYRDFAAGLPAVADVLVHGYGHRGGWSPSRQRHHGRPPVGLGGRHLVSCLQNHDQIGNRARGERIGHLAGPRAQMVAAALVLTAPFVPLLFQGEEWAASAPFPYVADHTDPALAQAVRDGRRAEFAAFGWAPEDVLDPLDPATFALARLRWDERADDPHAEVLAWYRRLIALRRSTPDLLDDRLDRTVVVVDEAARVLRVQRGAVTVVANLGDAEVDLGLDAGERVVLRGDGRSADHDALAPCAAAVALSATAADR